MLCFDPAGVRVSFIIDYANGDVFNPTDEQVERVGRVSHVWEISKQINGFVDGFVVVFEFDSLEAAQAGLAEAKENVVEAFQDTS